MGRAPARTRIPERDYSANDRASAVCVTNLGPRTTYLNRPSCSRVDSTPGIGSASRCTSFHSPFSRRNINVTRSEYGTGASPPTEAVVRSLPTTYPRSPLTPEAVTSNSADVQLEKLDASQSKRDSTAVQPLAVLAAPNTVTGSL